MDKKSDQLGIPFGTANGRLRKILLFSLAKKLGLDVCFRCRDKIILLEDFTIDHKIPWLDSTEPTILFFDIDNIAFSHNRCNVGDRRHNTVATKEGHERRKRKISKRLNVPDGMQWCSKGHLTEVTNFTKNKYKPNGLESECRPCRKVDRAVRYSLAKRRLAKSQVRATRTPSAKILLTRPQDVVRYRV